MTVHTLTTPGTTVAVSTGDVVEISLPEAGGSGYVWEVETCPSPVVLADSSWATPSPAPGATGTRTLRFDVVEPLAGPALLRLALRRPWETDTAAHAVFDVRLVAGRAQGLPPRR